MNRFILLIFSRFGNYRKSQLLDELIEYLIKKSNHFIQCQRSIFLKVYS